MAKKKKNTWRWAGQTFNWLVHHKNIGLAVILILIALLYFPWHAYRVYADNKKFSSDRNAIDAVYADIGRSLGQPDNSHSLNTCGDGACLISTSFVYPVSDRTQAIVLMKGIQSTMAMHKDVFSRRGKLSTDFSDRQIVDSVYHDALDHYSGPRHTPCQVKYIYDTPDETDLSVQDGSRQAFEVNISCSDRSAALVYPSIQSL